MSRVLELSLDHRCNLRCLGCRACVPTGDALSPALAAGLLRDAYVRGARTAWFGGGEPTLRDDLLPLVRHARGLGYDAVVVQTNAARLSYAAYARALAHAGVTDVRVNAKSARADVHDRLSSSPGSHALLVQALGHLADLAPRVTVTADVLLAVSTAPHLDETVAFFADRGVRAFALWLLHGGDVSDPAVDAEVPRLPDLVAPLTRAHALARARALSLVSFHTPPCTLPPALRAVWQPAADLGITVVDACGHSFPLETSSFEGGGHIDACAGCSAGPRCRGPRADYVRLHGAGEFHALRST